MSATLARLVQLIARYAPDAQAEQVNLWAHAVSGAGEQLGRWWLRNPDVPRERVIAFYADFLDAAASHLIESSADSASTNSHPRRSATGAVGGLSRST